MNFKHNCTWNPLLCTIWGQPIKLSCHSPRSDPQVDGCVEATHDRQRQQVVEGARDGCVHFPVVNLVNQWADLYLGTVG